MPIDHAGRRFVMIGGLRVYVSSEAEAEAATITICGNASYFPDDCHGACASCGAPIVYRPHMPKRPPKVCVDCARIILRDLEEPH
jgi:hypothetical protein